MNSNKQVMRGVKSGGEVVQYANVDVHQTMDDIDAAGDVEQLIAIVQSDTKGIAVELSKLHAKVQEYDASKTEDIQRLKDAEEAAKRGDGTGIVSNLKKVGAWVVDFAKETGTSVAAKVIEKALGL